MPITLDAMAKKKLVGVNANLVKLVERAAQLSKQDFTIVQGNRTAEYQHKLWLQGRGRPGPVVTWKDGYKNKSNHQGGRAVDFAAKAAGKISWNTKYYPAVAAAFKAAAAELKIKIVWGGDWHKKDWGHIELG